MIQLVEQKEQILIDSDNEEKETAPLFKTKVEIDDTIVISEEELPAQPEEKQQKEPGEEKEMVAKETSPLFKRKVEIDDTIVISEEEQEEKEEENVEHLFIPKVEILDAIVIDSD